MTIGNSLPPPVMSPLPDFVFPTNSKQLVPFTAMFAATRRLRLGVRPSFVGLLALFALSVFCLLHQHLNDTPRSLPPSELPTQSLRHPTRPQQHDWRHTWTSKPQRPKISLTPEQELAAVVGFMAALPYNALPDSVDPRVSIDADLVLDFDTRAMNAELEVRQLVEDTWARLPVVLLSKRYSPAAREIKRLLSEYSLNPSPTVFDLDERADASVSTPLLYRLTNTTDLPILLIGGHAIGSVAKIRELHSSGELRKMISASGAVVDGTKKKKGRRVAKG